MIYTLANSPSVRLCAVFIISICLNNIILEILIYLTISLCISRLSNKGFTKIFLFAIFFFVLIFSTFFEVKQDKKEELLITKGRIIFHPKIQGNNKNVIAYSEEYNLNVALSIPKNVEVGWGDLIELECIAKYDEKNYYHYYNIFYAAKDCGVLEITKTQIWYELASTNIRVALLERLEALFPPNTALLLKGILIGGSEELPNYLVLDYKEAGIIHIMAVSGFNMSLANGIILLFIRKTNPFIKWVVSTVFLLAYLMIIGFDNIPGFRAFICCVLMQTGCLLGRRPNSIYIVIFSGMILLLLFPSIYESISYQLSMMAGLAMSYNAKYASNLIVNAFVSPILSLYFAKLNLIGIVTNIVLQPIIPLITYFSLIQVLNPLPFDFGLGSIIHVLVNILNQIAAYFATIGKSFIVSNDNSVLTAIVLLILSLMFLFELSFRKFR